MTKEQILEKFRETDALLEGRFVLSSGLHSPMYLQCARALQFPKDAEKFGRSIAEELIKLLETLGASPSEVRTIASPAIGGLVIGYEVAKALNVRFIWTERKEGVMKLRRGFEIADAEKMVVVEDVITTGGSVRECIDVLKENGADVIAGASIIDRSGGKSDIGVPRIALASLEVPVYEPDAWPTPDDGLEAVKPGSRGN